MRNTSEYNEKIDPYLLIIPKHITYVSRMTWQRISYCWLIKQEWTGHMSIAFTNGLNCKACILYYGAENELTCRWRNFVIRLMSLLSVPVKYM